jgi:hypothetical protein
VERAVRLRGVVDFSTMSSSPLAGQLWAPLRNVLPSAQNAGQ